MDIVPLTGNTLSKQERLSGKTGIARLMSKAVYGSAKGLKFCYVTGSGADCNRIMVSVSKRLFKRAVKRNLLKRRIREGYRCQKNLLPQGLGIDILFMYNTKEMLDYETIKSSVREALSYISSSVQNDKNNT